MHELIVQDGVPVRRGWSGHHVHELGSKAGLAIMCGKVQSERKWTLVCMHIMCNFMDVCMLCHELYV